VWDLPLTCLNSTQYYSGNEFKKQKMKSLKLIGFGIVLFLACTLQTQAQVSLHINIGSPPQWGPEGYSEARYYYLPDVEAYYDIHTSMFIYFGNGVWIHRSYLPERYRNYDLYDGYKVVMTDYHGNYPYVHFRDHKMKYARGYRGHKQRNIGHRPGRDSHERDQFQDRPRERNNYKDNSQKESKYQHDNNQGNSKNEERGNNKHNKKNNGNDGKKR